MVNASMLVNVVLPNHGSEVRNASEIRIIQQGLLKRLPSVKVGMFCVVNTWSIYHEGVTGSCNRGRAIHIMLFFLVA